MALHLEQALDAVQADLLAGQIDGLAAHAARIEDLLPKIAGLDDLPLARRLHEKSARNAACLDASSRGIRSARRRFEEILSARRGLATYDELGRRTPFFPQDGRLAHRL
jgi:hypothetical protein